MIYTLIYDSVFYKSLLEMIYYNKMCIITHKLTTKINYDSLLTLLIYTLGQNFFYPPTKSEGYSFGCVCPSVHSVRPSIPSVCTFCLSRTISQYLLVRFNLFLVQMISTMNSRYPISLVKIDPLTLELLPLFKYRQL